MLKDNYIIIKGACKIKHRKVYLLIRKDTLEVLRMAWGVNYEGAKDYFESWLLGNSKFTMDDCFVVKVCKKSVK